jgi:hypothetical protein
MPGHHDRIRKLKIKQKKNVRCVRCCLQENKKNIFVLIKKSVNNDAHHRQEKKEVTCARNKHVVFICINVNVSFSNSQCSFLSKSIKF